MLHRNQSPNKDKWNGVGGKIKQGEIPEESVMREVLEETGINLKDALDIYYAGIVTWITAEDIDNANRGMHAYIAEIPASLISWDEKETDEGILAWKSLSWVCDMQNSEVVPNIPHFLPFMLKKENVQEYFCVYKDGKFIELQVKPIPQA